ncbi:MAG TPA: hypothetical protein VK611_07305 [Acidimicrobiales bacterium]|nr:hypothetical protein [Acidimicrobiales bacterium]
MSTRRSRPVRFSLLVALTVALAGVACSGDDDDSGGRVDEPDGASLVEPFNAAAEEAYEAAGSDRQEDFTRGVAETGCFVLDEAGAVAVADALGVDDPDGAELAGDGFISGPPDDRELLVCPISLAGVDENVGVNAGTLDGDRAEVLQDMRRGAELNDDEIEEVDGEAPGLDGDHVLAVARDGATQLVWVDGGFGVSLTVPDDVADAEAGFRALPVLVDAVAASLAGS